MPEVNVQRDTNVIVAFNEQEASELLTLLYAVNDHRCPWALELRRALAGERIPEVCDLSDIIDTDVVVMA